MNNITINDNFKKLIQSYLVHSEDRVKYKNHAQICKDNEGSQIDPWEYQKYRALVKNCLDSISEIYKTLGSTPESYPEKILIDAHFIKQLNAGFIGDKKITHRKITINLAESLHLIFEKLTVQLNVFSRSIKYSSTGNYDVSDILKSLNEFSITWKDFTTTLEKDRSDAQEYSKTFSANTTK